MNRTPQLVGLSAVLALAALSGCSSMGSSSGKGPDTAQQALTTAEAALNEARAARAAADAAIQRAAAAEAAAARAMSAANAGVEAKALADQAMNSATSARQLASEAMQRASETQGELERMDEKSERMFRKSQMK
jgi:hypothetical protein